MTRMNPPRNNSRFSSPRRFILLREEPVDGNGQRPRIRRYQLASVGHRPALNQVDLATARFARELDHLGRI
jgi:hypothetical protein